MDIEAHKNINYLFKQRDFNGALQLAQETGMNTINTLAANMKMAQIYIGLHTQNKSNASFLEQGHLFAEKTVEAIEKREKTNPDNPIFQAYRVVAQTYNELAINRRINAGKQTGSEAVSLQEDSVKFSQKALGILDRELEILQKRKKEVSKTGDNEQYKSLLKEEIYISNTKINTAFSKHSLKLVLTSCKERRDRFGIYDKNLFGGIDTIYFSSLYTAYLGLKDYQAVADIKEFAEKVCKNMREDGLPERLVKSMNKSLDIHVRIHGAPSEMLPERNLPEENNKETPQEIIVQTKPPFSAIKTLIDKAVGFFKSGSF